MLGSHLSTGPEQILVKATNVFRHRLLTIFPKEFY